MITYIKRYFCLSWLCLITPLYSQTLTLDYAVEQALANNNEIKLQEQALLVAQGKLLEQKGNFDFILGSEASYGLAQNPVDEKDPSFKVDDGVGIFNTITHNAGGGISLQKLFSFGLHASLSYSINHNRQYSQYKLLKPPEDFSPPELDGRNSGKVSLELTLPLLKSFNDSISKLQFDSAHSYYLQMGHQLEDKIGQTIVTTTKHYLEYSLAYDNLKHLETMGATLEERRSNVEKLVSTRASSRNDLLSVEISLLENQRNIELAKIQVNSTRLQLSKTMGVEENQLEWVPELPPVPNQDLVSTVEAALLGDDGEINPQVLKEIARKNNNILGLQESLVQAEKNLAIVKIDSRPDLDLKFNIGVAGATYSNNFGQVVGSPFLNVKGVDVQGKLSLQVHLGGSLHKGKIQQAQGQYESARLSLEHAMDNLEGQIHYLYNSLLIYQSNLQRASKVLELQQQLYENEKTRFNAALITITTLQNQDTQYLQAQKVYNESLVQYMNTIVEMKYYSTNLVTLNN